MIFAASLLACCVFLGGGGTRSAGIMQATAHPISAAPGTRSTAKVKVTVRQGYHVQTDSVKEDFLIPTVLTLDGHSSLFVEDVTFPPGEPLTFEGVDEPWSALGGAFEVLVAFRISGDAPAGTLHWRGVIRYQACDHQRCFPPSTVEFDIPVEVL